MSNKMQVLQYHPSIEVRMVMQNGEPWWVLLDVCRVLGIQNHRDVVKRLDDDEKGVDSIDTPGGPQEMTVINESGLYSVILRSDKPEAKAFKRWVTHEVLPSIRRTGTYTATGTGQAALPGVQPMPVSKTAQLIYRVLRDLERAIPYAFGEVQISNRRLCQLVGIHSNKTLITARKELVDAGYILVSPGAKGNPTIYQVQAK